MKENIYPELSGMELHYSSVNGLAIQNPLNFQSSTSGPTTGGLDNPFVAPGAAESLGASGGKPINGMFADEVGKAFGKMQIDFEKHLMFGKHEVKFGVDPYDGVKRPYDYAPPSEKEIALKFLEDIKKMPHCILVEMIIDPEEMYEINPSDVLLIKGWALSHRQEEIIIERFKEHCIAKLSVPY